MVGGLVVAAEVVHQQSLPEFGFTHTIVVSGVTPGESESENVSLFLLTITQKNSPKTRSYSETKQNNYTNVIGMCDTASVKIDFL